MNNDAGVARDEWFNPDRRRGAAIAAGTVAVKVREQALVILPQITLRDLDVATAGFDRDELVRRMGVPEGESDLPLWARVLLEHPLQRAAELRDWSAPFRWSPEWQRVVAALRLRDWDGTSSLAEEGAVGTSTYRLTPIDGKRFWVQQARLRARGHRTTHLRTRARTLGVTFRRRPAPEGFEIAPPVEGAPDAEVEALADLVQKLIEPTIGGAAFLGIYGRSQALAVLAATVATVLGDGAGQRWHPTRKLRVARADVYRDVIGALGLGGYFAAARRFIEADHPDHFAVSAPWPPGTAGAVRDVAILTKDGGSLVLRGEARLDVLGPLVDGPTEDDVDA